MAREDVDALARRLSVTGQALDARPDRPNAVLLLSGETFVHSRVVAERLADVLYGTPTRVVPIDFSRMPERHDMSMLIGAPPGYVGYTDALPLHELSHAPWSVLYCENVHACHPVVREVLRQGLHEGFITDAVGKRIFLSDAVVLLSAQSEGQSRRAMGFVTQGSAVVDDQREQLRELLGAGLLAEVDIVCLRTSGALIEDTAVETDLLESLRTRFRKQGLEVSWDQGVLAWLSLERREKGGRAACERAVDEYVAPHLVRWLPAGKERPGRRLIIKYVDGAVNVQAEE
jgi:ATP-dependent Clp protease ATP-binding subunit ClpA